MKETKLKINIKGDHTPNKNAKIKCILVNSHKLFEEFNITTNSHGDAQLIFDSSSWKVDATIVIPQGDYWSMVTEDSGPYIELNCPPIAPGPLGWWHHALNIKKPDYSLGQGVKIGVIDTGVGPNASLDHVINLGFINNEHYTPDQGLDIDGHGTNVCGVIAATPKNLRDYAGIAPSATVYSLRVFQNQLTNPNPKDIAKAIIMLADQHKVDLINISQATNTPSSEVHQAILHALKQGVLTICAAGNNMGALSYPAAFPETVSVSAIGNQNEMPSGSIAGAMLSRKEEHLGTGHFSFSAFSNFGDNVNCTAPGVGIITTCPDEKGETSSYGDQSGTSIACAMVTGTLAAILSKNKEFKSLKANSAKVDQMRRLLLENCHDIGLNSEYQGAGLLKFNQ